MFLRSFSFGLMGFFLLNPSAFSVATASAAKQEATPAYAQALRSRVEQYYSLMQLARFEEAEALVAPASRDNFRRMPKNPFLDCEIGGIRFEPKDSTAPEKA